MTPSSELCCICRVSSVSGYLPAIFTAWQWRGSKSVTGQRTGKCLPCSGKANDIYCAYLFPCFGINTTTGGGVGFGHRDVAILPPWYQNQQYEPRKPITCRT